MKQDMTRALPLIHCMLHSIAVQGKTPIISYMNSNTNKMYVMYAKREYSEITHFHHKHTNQHIMRGQNK